MPKSSDASPTWSSRIFFVLTAFVLLGLPLMVAGQLLGSRVPGAVTRGAQPGGEFEGRLVDGDDEPIGGMGVELWLRGAQARDNAEETVQTDEDGRFVLSAPATRGYYEIRTGGGEWMKARQEASFLDVRGKAVDPPSFEFTLRPGAVLDVTLTPAKGRTLGGGQIILDGRWSEPGSLFFATTHQHRESLPIEGTHIRLDGLPPLHGQARIEFNSGRVLEFPLRLTAGETSRATFEF